MPDTKLTALGAIASVAAEDLFYVVDDPAGTPSSTKATAAQVKTYVNDWTVISSGSVSAAASLDFTNLSTTYRAYKVVFDNLAPANDVDELWVRTDTNNGASFEAGVADYGWAVHGLDGTPASSPERDSSDSEIQLSRTNEFGNLTGEIAAGEITIINPATAGSKTFVQAMFTQVNSAAVVTVSIAGGLRLTAEANNAVRILFAGGNIATMNYTFYGLRAS